MPAYYLLAGVEGKTPEQALSENIAHITRQVREELDWLEGISDEEIQAHLYIVREGGLVSLRNIRTF
jgi:DNA-binding transcriptional ArsR family regulator